MIRLSALCLIIFTALFLLQACDYNRVFDDNTTLPDKGWEKNVKQAFGFSIDDTTTSYNILINVRNESDYAWSNLYLFIKMISPSGQFFMDTLEVTLADNNGRWLGSGIGNIWQVSSPLVKGVRLKEKGKYQVEIAHGMRTDFLMDIRNVGIRVEYAKR